MQPVRYSEHYVELVRSYSISGVASNDDIAEVIGLRFNRDVKAGDVARWRAQHWRFNKACVMSLREANQQVANIALQRALDGDDAMVRYWLDRRHPDFMPKNKTEHAGRLETLHGLLQRRQLSEDDLLADGTLYEGEPE